MKKDIKMIGLDLDGTVLTDHSTVSPRVRAAIQKAIAAGIVVLPATGRALTGIPPQVLEIPGIRYALTANGAKVVELKTGETVYSDCFEKEHAVEVLRFLKTFDTAPAIYLGGKGYSESIAPAQWEKALDTLPESIVQYLKASRIFVDNLEEFIVKNEHSVEKFTMMFFDKSERQRALEAAWLRPDITTTWALTMGMEVNTSTANKGQGLVELGNLLGISQPQIMAVGDGRNDIMMLKTVGYGVAMGNADDEVKAAADAVTLPCSEDGVAAAIEEILPVS